MIDVDIELNRPGFSLQARGKLEAEVTGLMGVSGAGKSTLLGIIAGYVKPDRGRVILHGQSLVDTDKGIHIPMHHRHIGMVFQDSRLFPHMNVRENLLYGLKLLPAKEQRFAYRQITDLLEIGHLEHSRAHALSGGEKQRVALGRALLASPRLLLLDEPLASLDVQLKNQILPFLRRVRDEFHIPMIYVSHAIHEVLYLTSQVALMSQGQLLDVGNFHEVMRNDRMLAVAQSLGLENLVQGTVISHDGNYGYSTVMVGEEQLQIPLVVTPIGNEISVSIAASNIVISRERLNGISILNQLPGKVIGMQELNGRSLLKVDTGNCTLLVEFPPLALHGLQIDIGAQVYCLIKTQDIVPLPARG